MTEIILGAIFVVVCLIAAILMRGIEAILNELKKGP